jgi:hypothetical protein
MEQLEQLKHYCRVSIERPPREAASLMQPTPPPLPTIHPDEREEEPEGPRLNAKAADKHVTCIAGGRHGRDGGPWEMRGVSLSGTPVSFGVLPPVFDPPICW